MVQVHRVACLLGTSIGVGTSVCLLAGLAASYATETDPLLGVTAGGVFGVLLSVGVFIGAASNLDVKGSGKLSEPLVPSGADVTHTFKKKAKMGIAFAVRRSTRDGNRWLVVAELAKLGQAAAVPGIAPGMAVKSAQGQPLDLGEFKSVLRERPLEVTFGVVDREPGAPPVPPPPEEEPDEGEEEEGEEPDEPEPEPEEGAGEEEGGDDASPPPLPGPPPLDELPGPPPGPPPDELPGPPPGPPPPEEPVDVGKLEMIFRKFDEDADGILSFMETNKFMVATGNKPFNENQWQAVCKMAGGANPDSGLTLEQFAQVETSAEEDFAILFPPTEELEMIFLKFDEDCDDLLNIVEFNQLMAATGGQQLDKIQWRALCKKVEANPLAGLSPEQLGRLEGDHLATDFLRSFGVA